jgi:hypothetical protein
MSLVFVGVGFMGFIAAAALAIDIGMLTTARAQAQNSADSGAMAGAVALILDDWNDRSESGPAMTHAMARAKQNYVIGEEPSVLPEDVAFLNDPVTGQPNRVQVQVHRTTERGNPMPTFIARLFNVDSVGITARATAEASPANVPFRCFPFTLPDRWREVTDPPFDAMTSTYDIYQRVGNGRGTPLTPADVYNPPGPDYTGYDPIDDRGTLIRIKAEPGTTIAPSTYFPIVVPGDGSSTGADKFKDAIVNGTCPAEDWGENLVSEPGMMHGPTEAGINQIVNEDPYAQWDEGCRCVMGSTNPKRPRVGVIPLFDPKYFEDNMRMGRGASYKVVNYLGVFIEGMRGNEVIARITPAIGGRGGDTNLPDAMFLKAVRLVQ